MQVRLGCTGRNGAQAVLAVTTIPEIPVPRVAADRGSEGVGLQGSRVSFGCAAQMVLFRWKDCGL